MATETTIQQVGYPSYISDRQQQLLNQLYGTTGAPGGLIDQPLNVPGRVTVGLQQPTLDAITDIRALNESGSVAVDLEIFIASA